MIKSCTSGNGAIWSLCQDCYSSEKYDQDSLHQKIKKSSLFPNFTSPTCHTRQEPISFLPASN